VVGDGPTDTAGAGFQALVREMNDRGVCTTRGGELSVSYVLPALDSGFGRHLNLPLYPPWDTGGCPIHGGVMETARV